MRVTKFIVFTFLLYFVPPQSKAQSFVKSYYISATGDSVVGTALTDSYTKTSKEIRFKTPNGQETVLNPENIQRVWLFPDWYFEAKNIHFVNLTNTFDGWFFLRVLTRTDSVCLYKFELNQFEGFYVQRKGETLKSLQIFYDFAGNPQLSTYKIGDVVVDTISISNQLNGFDNVGKYRTRKAFLFTLRDFFKECGDKIVQSDYKLTEQDVIQAFNSLAYCKQPGRKVPNFFKKTTWRPSIGITYGNSIKTKIFNYKLPSMVGIYMTISDLRNGIGFGVNWLKANPIDTAKFKSSGAFIEYALSYHRNLFYRSKFSVSGSLGFSVLKSNNLSRTAYFVGYPNPEQINPVEQRTYLTFGLSPCYQFVKNNYLSLQIQRNVYDIIGPATYFDRLQVQYEHRF